MTIYVVTSGCYSDYCVNALFLSREKAEVYCALHHCDDQEINEWETEDDTIDCDKPALKKWVGIIQENGEFSISDDGYSIKSMFEVKNVKRNYYVNPHQMIIMTTSKDKTEEQARKIMFDKLIELKYIKEMGGGI